MPEPRLSGATFSRSRSVQAEAHSQTERPRMLKKLFIIIGIFWLYKKIKGGSEETPAS